MMWFDKRNPLAIFQDQRAEVVRWNEDSEEHPARELRVEPDVVGDFTKMDFPDNSFHLIAFDPPHYTAERFSENSRTAKMYGRLFADWETSLAAGFSECFRVLKPFGVLVFKWNSTMIPLERVLALSPEPPLFGHTTGRQAKTHWVTFIKQNASGEPHGPNT